MNVLIICDRYDWGGASKVAKSLHEMLLDNGNNSIYLYGYDKKGLPAKQIQPNVFTSSYLLAPHINFIYYNLIGKNIMSSKQKLLEKYIQGADVIHVHNIHDYGFNYEQIFKLINQYNKPTVLTCHDDWFITGRCSLTNTCLGWQNGCNPCLNKKNYHKSIIDIAASEFVKKTKLINSIKHLKIVTLSNWLFENVSSIYTKAKCTVITNGVNTDIFRYKKNQVHNNKTTLLLIASDFTDKRKTDPIFMALLLNSNIEVHTIGANSPFNGKNIFNHGRKSSVEIAAMMNELDYHLFLSKEDYNPLVVLESLCCGMAQLTFKSKAIKGLNIDKDCVYIEDFSAQELIYKLESQELNNEYCSEEKRQQRAEISIKKYSKEVMYNNYLKEYENLLQLIN